MEIPRTLLVTNDYPPRIGGIERTLEALVGRLPPERVAVLCPSWEGAESFDLAADSRVFRQPERFLWPTRETAGHVRDALAEHGAEVVLFGAAYPLVLLGPGLAREAIPYVSLTHGFEYWLSIAPGGHSLLRRGTSGASRVTVCSEFIGRVIRTAVPDHVPVSVLYSGADTRAFRPDLAVEHVRERHGLADRPLVVCVSRLVARKGQDVLIRAMPAIRRRVPGAALLIVGDGPYRGALERLAVGAERGSVVFAGRVSEEELPHYYRAGDVFAMPCRSRLGGLEVEGWGNVFLEAAACGRPVVVGDSGGAREALVDGETGLLVDGRSVAGVAEAISTLLSDPARAQAMGNAGRERVERSFTWAHAAARLSWWLREAAS